MKKLISIFAGAFDFDVYFGTGSVPRVPVTHSRCKRPHRPHSRWSWWRSTF